MNIKIRYAGNDRMPYDYDIELIAPMNLISAFQHEQHILNNHKSILYKPKTYFAGHSECLSVNPISLDQRLKDLKKITRFI